MQTQRFLQQQSMQCAQQAAQQYAAQPTMAQMQYGAPVAPPGPPPGIGMMEPPGSHSLRRFRGKKFMHKLLTDATIREAAKA